MTAPKIVPYDMDVHAEPIAEHAARHPQHPIDLDKYAALGGMRPGMIAGPKTDLPIPALSESTWHALRHGWFAAAALLAIPTIIAAGLAIYLAVTGQLS